MSDLAKIKEPKKARIGLYSAGLHAYWEQFDGLLDCLMGYNRFIAKKLGQWGEVYNFGIVDTEDKGREAGEFFNQHNVDIIFSHAATYYTSACVLPVHQISSAPCVILNLQPGEFAELSLHPAVLLILRLIMSFIGVFGFSIMFNSPVTIAASAAGIGAIANTLRLELVSLISLNAAVAAFLGALTAGLLASLLMKRLGYPRISVTVPSIVIMVPGLYLYRAVYSMGEMSLTQSAPWLVSALLIIMALPLGLIFARIISDRSFRHCT